MWLSRIALCILAICLVSEAVAGAWPRGRDKAFLSFETTYAVDRKGALFRGCPPPSVLAAESRAYVDSDTGQWSYRQPSDSEWAHCIMTVNNGGLVTVSESAMSLHRIFSSVFLEYGVSETLTLGLDIGHNRFDGSWTALGFARRSFSTDSSNVFALEIGGGVVRTWDGDYGVAIRPGFHWGRGMDRGWLSADSYVELESERQGLAYKLDLTAGWNITEKDDLILQVQTSDYPGADPVVRLAPAYVRRVGAGKRIKLGLVADLTGRAHVGVTAGTWLDF